MSGGVGVRLRHRMNASNRYWLGTDTIFKNMTKEESGLMGKKVLKVTLMVLLLPVAVVGLSIGLAFVFVLFTAGQ
jgi:hypothetical protein